MNLSPQLPRCLRLAAVVALAFACACHGPAPIESSVEFATEHGIVRGVSTEDGIFALADLVPPNGELSFRFRTGNGFFDDVAHLERRNDVLAIFRPKSSRPNLARFAAFPAAHDDLLFIEVRTGEHADLIRCDLLDEGRRGDLVVPREATLVNLATRYAGAGIFAWRSGTMQLVGILNGVYCEDPLALAFIGLDEMSGLLPAESSYFTRRVLPRRTDFEYGIPRDFEGERPFAADPARPDEKPATEPVPPAKPEESPPKTEETPPKPDDQPLPPKPDGA